MKILFSSLLLAPLVIASFEQKPANVAAVNFDVVRLADGVYACINRFGGKAICNAGIMDNGESTIIFETFLSPDAAEELIRVAAQLNVSPIRYVVNSHYHNDHVRGNQCFPAEVKILSTKRTAELMASEEPKSIAAEKIYGPVQYRRYDSLCAAYKGDTTAREYQNIKFGRTYFEELSESYRTIRTRLPDTYVVEEMSVNGSKRKVRLINEGAGHTQSDLILYLPDDSTVFAGDLVFNKCYPYLGDGSIGGLKNILTKMESMPVRTVVPGHGDVGGRESIKAMRDYVDDMEAIVKKLKREGRGKEDLKNIRIPETYRDWWMEEFFPGNLEYLYDSI